MKKSMKKFIVACAAVSAITVAAGMSAMAADYTAENNSVKFNVPAGDADTQKTVLVIPADKKGNVAEGDILYINQDVALADTALLKGTEKLADGKYVAMVGYYKDGAFAIAEDEFTVGDVNPGVDVTIGDVDDNGRITASDAGKILSYVAANKSGIDEGTKAFAAASKCNGLTDTRITATDAGAILTYVAQNKQHEIVGQVVKVEVSK